MYHAFVSDGRLYICDERGELKEITSKFAREKTENAEYQRARHGWKSSADGSSPYFNSQIVWGGQAANAYVTNFRFKSVMCGDADTLYYVLTNNSMTGLFRYEISEGYETRLFHRRDFIEFGVDYSPVQQQFVAAVATETGSVGLERMNAEGQYEETITAGDARDSNPSFSKQYPGHVLYQTAGIGRDHEGNVMAFSSEAINKIDLETGQITGLLSDERFDFMLPRDDAQGNLYCIRRPYQHPGYRSPLHMLWYAVTFPFRFVVAVVRFLDAFTKLFGAEPMKPAGPDVRPPIQNKYVHVLGQTVDLAKVDKKSSIAGEPSLVPASWELVKFTPDGMFEVIARKVVSYDLDANGCLYYTDGFKIKALSQDCETTILKHNIIEDIRVVAHS